jgi:hypothetical protein
MLKQNLKNINWYYLSYNPSTEAVELLKQNPDKVDWSLLSAELGSGGTAKQNPDEISVT